MHMTMTDNKWNIKKKFYTNIMECNYTGITNQV